MTSIDPTTVTVSRDPCGRWYVSFAVDVADPGQLPATGAVVGVDLGIKDFAVTSDGEKIPNPRRLARRERNLARYQRRLARCQNGSANRAKARAKVARAHRKVRASRADFLHRASARLVRDHDVIVIEDLAVKNMVRNRSLAKAISDCGWGTFRRMVEYKAARAGRHLIVIDRWYPVQQDMLGLRAPARRAEPVHEALDSARPAAPGTTGTSTPRRTSWRQVLPFLPAELA